MTWRECCEPFVVGMALYHQRSCEFRPNQKLMLGELADWRAFRKLDRADAILHHPAKGSAIPLRLVQDEAYMEAHSDDLDDREELER